MKAEATQHFKAGKFDKAIESFYEAVNTVRFGNETFKNSKEGKTLELACRGNIALCKMKKNDWDGAIDQCEQILSKDEENFKAIYRMAQALRKKNKEVNR